MTCESIASSVREFTPSLRRMGCITWIARNVGSKQDHSQIGESMTLAEQIFNTKKLTKTQKDLMMRKLVLRASLLTHSEECLDLLIFEDWSGALIGDIDDKECNVLRISEVDLTTRTDFVAKLAHDHDLSRFRSESIN